LLLYVKSLFNKVTIDILIKTVLTIILSGGLAVLEKPGRVWEMKNLAIYFPEERTDSRTMTWGRELTLEVTC
jgi:hypothetical protein